MFLNKSRRYFTSIQNRGVFDIGSGSIKFQAAQVDSSTGKIIQPLVLESKQTLFMKDLKMRDSNCLSPSIQMEGK